jgi:hypothetical protein
MSCKEVITFWLDMGAPISLLSRAAPVRGNRVARRVKRDRRRHLTCTDYARVMASTRESGPDPDEITGWITATYPETVVATALGATFFSLDEKHWPNFATIVTTDEHDMGAPSNLARPGVFRLNIGVGKMTFERLVGSMDEPDYAALDQVLPHPVYARQRWLAILNPSRESFDAVVKPLIAEAYERLATARRRPELE